MNSTRWYNLSRCHRDRGEHWWIAAVPHTNQLNTQTNRHIDRHVKTHHFSISCNQIMRKHCSQASFKASYGGWILVNHWETRKRIRILASRNKHSDIKRNVISFQSHSKMLNQCCSFFLLIPCTILRQFLRNIIDKETQVILPMNKKVETKNYYAFNKQIW